jgi:hypothetical protein
MLRSGDGEIPQQCGQERSLLLEQLPFANSAILQSEGTSEHLALYPTDLFNV